MIKNVGFFYINSILIVDEAEVQREGKGSYLLKISFVEV